MDTLVRIQTTYEIAQPRSREGEIHVASGATALKLLSIFPQKFPQKNRSGGWPTRL